MKKNLLVIAAVLCFAALSVGQQPLEAVDQNKLLAFGNPYNASNQNFINVMNSLESNKQFSLLLLPTWKPMEVVGVDNELIAVDTANYHVQDDKFLFVYHGQLYQLYPGKVTSATIDGREFVTYQYDAGDKRLKKGYFEVLVDGDYQLLKKYVIEKEVVNDHPLGLPATKEETLITEGVLYYLPDGQSRPRDLPSKKSEFADIFRSNKKEIVDYAKANKLNPRKEDEVIQIFTYYNNMISQ